MLVGQGLVVVGVYPKIARARVGLGAGRVVRAEAAAVGAPTVLCRWRTVHRTPGACVGEYHMTNAGFSDVTTVSHESASTSITPPADSLLASKKACVDRSSRQSRSPRRRREDAIGVGRLFDATLPLACHTPLDDGYGQPCNKTR